MRPLGNALLPAGVHLLPFTRPDDGAFALVACNDQGEAVIGPEYVLPNEHVLDAAYGLLERASRAGVPI